MEKVKWIRAEVSQEEARVELRPYSEEISHCSAYNLDRKSWNMCFPTVAQKQEADTAKIPETLTKRGKWDTLESNDSCGWNWRETNKKKLIFLRILTKIWRKTQDSKLQLRILCCLESFLYISLVWTWYCVIFLVWILWVSSIVWVFACC